MEFKRKKRPIKEREADLGESSGLGRFDLKKIKPSSEANSDKDSVYKKLEDFVSYFVQELEINFHIIVKFWEEKSEKGEKFANFLENVLATVSSSVLPPLYGLSKFLIPGSKYLVKKFVGTVGKPNKKNFAPLMDTIKIYHDDKKDFRRHLVEAGFNIFQCFEEQFMKLNAIMAHEDVMQLIAKEAVNRVIHCMKPDELTISESAIFVNSKTEDLNLTHSFDVVYVTGTNEIWKITDIFDKCGVVKEYKNGLRCYFKKKDGTSDTCNYGFRRLLASEDWDDHNYGSKYEEDHNVKVKYRNYEYVLRDTDAKIICENILKNINDSNENVTENRMKEIFKEIKAEIIQGLNILMQQHHDLLQIQEELNLIKRSIDNLVDDNFFKNISLTLQTNEAKNRELHNKTHKGIKKIQRREKIQTRYLREVHQVLVPQKIVEENVSALDIAYYIPQTITCKSYLKIECLKGCLADIFAISNASIFNISKLVRPGENVQKFSESMERCRYVVLNEINPKSDFEDLCQKCSECNVHWLEMKDNHTLKWLQTHGNISNLRQFVEKIESDKYEPQKVDDFNDNLIIITADPGMGKSTLLNNLKFEQDKQSGKFLQVIKINLIDYASKLSKEKFCNITQTTEFFKTFLPKVQLEKSAILFDGFDEICPVHERKDKFINAIKK